MALLFWEGGEGIRVTSGSDLTEKWVKAGGTVVGGTAVFSFVADVVRSGMLGARSFGLATQAATAYMGVSALSEVVVQFWTLITSSHDVLLLQDAAGNTHFKITKVLNGANSEFRFWDANNSLVHSLIITNAKWAHLGVHLTVGGGGHVKIWHDDSIIYDADGDFLNGATASVSRVTISGTRQTDSPIDDLVIMDTTGGAFDTYLGSGVHCFASFPTAAGDSTQLTPSAGSNFQNVDDTDPNEDTDYNSSATAGHLDLYNITDLPAAVDEVLGIDIWARMRKDNGGTEEAKIAIKTNSVVHYGSNEALTNSYSPYRKQYLLNPETVAAFTTAEANALQIGLEVV